MKRITVIMIAALFAVATSIKADDSKSDTRGSFIFGPKIGMNYANVYDAEGEEFTHDSKFGLVVGGFISVPIGKFIGIQPELLFSQKGFKGAGTILGTSYSFKRTTNYIDIPIMFSIKPVENLTLLIGPQYSFLIKQTDAYDNALMTGQQIQEFDNDNIRKNILCIIGGVDVNIDHFVVGLRGGWDFMTNKGDGTSSTPRYKNVWFQATVGYRFYLD